MSDRSNPDFELRNADPGASESLIFPANPYSGHGPRPGAIRRPSPTYEPPSPPQASQRPPPPALVNPVQEASPSPAADLTFDQAISYAMQAQYMAGYWMGVAQGKRQEGSTEADSGSASSANVFTTRKQFGAAPQGLKR